MELYYNNAEEEATNEDKFDSFCHFITLCSLQRTDQLHLGPDYRRRKTREQKTLLKKAIKKLKE